MSLNHYVTFESKVGYSLSLAPGAAPDVRHSSSSPSCLPLHSLLLHSNSSITFTKKTSNSSHSIHMNSERLEKLNKKQLKHFSLRQTLIHSQVKTEEKNNFFDTYQPKTCLFYLSFSVFFVRDMNTKSTYSVYGAEIAEFDRKIVWHPSRHSCCLKWKQDTKVKECNIFNRLTILIGEEMFSDLFVLLFDLTFQLFKMQP